MTLAPFSTRFAAEAMVCTVDVLAAEAGIGALRVGGCAVDAAIAAGAVLAVTHQHRCGLGGDLLALVHEQSLEAPWALNASGRAGSGADPERLRAAGHRSMPSVDDIACASVPGCVDGWMALHERFGRLPLEALLEPALRLAAAGFAASASLAAASRALAGVPGTDDYTASGELKPGDVVRRPGVARALRAIAQDGRRGFYEGEFGRALLALGAGEYTDGDLARAHAEWVPPLGVEAFGHQLWSLPPSSQGYVLLRSAAIASGLSLPDPDDPNWAHRLIEVSRVSASDRDAVWHERSNGPELVCAEELEVLRARVSLERASGSAAAAVPGGTAALCVVDGERMAVSMLQSNFTGWGSMHFLPGMGVALHNRGSSFCLQPGHPAEYGPGRRPPHTLTPAMLTDPGGSLRATVATRGGHIQPQVLLQLLARVYIGSESPAEAVAAGRFATADDQVAVEAHAPEVWSRGLAARGHRVVPRAAYTQELGQAQLILDRGEHLAGASDPRSESWGAAAL